MPRRLVSVRWVHCCMLHGNHNHQLAFLQPVLVASSLALPAPAAAPSNAQGAGQGGCGCGGNKVGRVRVRVGRRASTERIDLPSP